MPGTSNRRLQPEPSRPPRATRVPLRLLGGGTFFYKKKRGGELRIDYEFTNLRIFGETTCYPEPEKDLAS